MLVALSTPKHVWMFFWNIVLSEQPVKSTFQPSSCWFEVKLKNGEVVLLIIPSALCNIRVPLAAKHPQSMMLPPPCLASSTAFLPLLLQCRFEPQWLVALVSVLPTDIPSECLGLSVVKLFIFMMANRNTQLTIITNKKSISLGFVKLKETANLLFPFLQLNH